MSIQTEIKQCTNLGKLNLFVVKTNKLDLNFPSHELNYSKLTRKQIEDALAISMYRKDDNKHRIIEGILNNELDISRLNKKFLHLLNIVQAIDSANENNNEVWIDEITQYLNDEAVVLVYESLVYIAKNNNIIFYLSTYDQYHYGVCSWNNMIIGDINIETSRTLKMFISLCDINSKLASCNTLKMFDDDIIINENGPIRRIKKD